MKNAFSLFLHLKISFLASVDRKLVLLEKSPAQTMSALHRVSFAAIENSHSIKFEFPLFLKSSDIEICQKTKFTSYFVK